MSKPYRTVAERVADADTRGSSWLAKANEFAEMGKKNQAERCYDKGQFWLDRSNKLRGNLEGTIVSVIKYSEGDSVTWTSQSAGTAKAKTGTIEQVVPAKCSPDRQRFVQLYKGSGVGLPRDHESYVVRVPGKTTKSAGKLYWPRSNALTQAVPKK